MSGRRRLLFLTFTFKNPTHWRGRGVGGGRRMLLSYRKRHFLFCNAIERSERKDPEIVQILSKALQGCLEKFGEKEPQSLLSEAELIEIEEDSKQCM